MRIFTVLTMVAVLGGQVASAAADGRFEIIDRGTEVEVIAHGAVAAQGAKVAVVRERLELPLVPSAASAKQLSDDATVRLLEVRGSSPRVLSLKLRGEHDDVVKLAPGASFVQVGDAIHFTIKRTPQPKVAPVPVPVPVPDQIETQPTAAPAAALAVPGPVATTPAPETRPAPTPTTIGATSTKRATSTRWWMILGGLILVGGGATALIRKKRNAPAVINQIEIIASRSLGGKSRIVWLAAGDREIVIAVSPQQIRPIGQWRRSAPATLGRGFDRALDDAERDLTELPSLGRSTSTSTSTEMPALGIARESSSEIPRLPGVRRADTSSPAISGLLRLRERGKVPTVTVNEDVATDDPEADAQWARDLIAAAGGRR